MWLRPTKLWVEPTLHLTCLVAGVVFLALVPYRPVISQGVYIDEHALMDGQSRAALSSAESVDRLDNDLTRWYVEDESRGCSSIFRTRNSQLHCAWFFFAAWQGLATEIIGTVRGVYWLGLTRRYLSTRTAMC